MNERHNKEENWVVSLGAWILETNAQGNDKGWLASENKGRNFSY
jgi:hypothetical protein